MTSTWKESTDTDPALAKFRKPDRHVARHVEERSPEDMERLEAADALVASYDLTADQLLDVLMRLRGTYRGPKEIAEPVWRFLDDIARAVDDAWIDRQDEDDVS